MPRRIDAQDVLAALGGLLVVISLFLTWFGDANGWEAFEALDLVLLALAAAAIAAALTGLGIDTPLGAEALPVLGAVLLVIVFVQLVQPPPGSDGADLGTGAWLALAGSVLVFIGGLLRVSRIAITVSVGGRETRRRVAAVDRRQERAGRTARAEDAADGAAPAGAEAEADAGARPSSGSRSLLDDPDPQATQPFSALEDR